jgi:hypothetical protein
MKKIICLLSLFIYHNGFSQNLLDGRIRKVIGKKNSLFFEQGVFHSTSQVSSRLNAVRHGFSKRRGYERIVIDFSTKKVPKIYGHFSKMDKKLSLDFFKTTLKKKVGSYGQSKYVEALKFYPLSKEFLSLEILFKEKVKAEVFYLESPARLVIDVKI